MTTVIVTGFRRFSNPDVVFAALGTAWELSVGGFTLRHGRCRTGADAIAQRWADLLNGGEMGQLVTVDAMPAEWERYGGSAGPRRNREMVAKGGDGVLAFLEDGQPNRGTWSSIRFADEASIPVNVYSSQGFITSQGWDFMGLAR